MKSVSTSDLAELGFFKEMPEEYLKVFTENAMAAEFVAAEFIFREGEPANCFYVILDGGVSLMSHKHQQLIETVGPGDLLGWSWLCPPYFWRFDARAIIPVKTLVFFGIRLREECDKNHGFGYEVMKRVATAIAERLQSVLVALPAKSNGSAKN
jgi:CRP/FNR family transcriptional regulator, cyclic AMP receptor protein